MSSLIATLVLIAALSTPARSYALAECTAPDLADGFKCHNGGMCIRVQLNATSSARLCNCAPGYTGRRCTQMETACMSSPCGENGFCNPVVDEADATPYTRDSNYPPLPYMCRCKPGFTGPTCQENVNECLNATCHNGGLCIDGINSYECECPWPYTGRYCHVQQSCRTDNVCQNRGVCSERVSRFFGQRVLTCQCQPGYAGVDCSLRVDKCQSRPCLNGAECVTLVNDYQCVCARGFRGKSCGQVDACAGGPCHNNATCIGLDGYGQDSYLCQCGPGFTGVKCDVTLACSDIACDSKNIKKSLLPDLKSITSTISETTTTTKAIEVAYESVNETNSNKNGSFVLVVNITPAEFQRRKTEIIAQFERQFGVLMLIKRNTKDTEMVYSFVPNKAKNETVWTKVYFIIIFACLYDTNQAVETTTIANAIRPPNNLCLENKVANINDNFEILNEMKKNPLPEYVSNITYEAYSSSKPSSAHTDDTVGSSRAPTESQLTTVLAICLAISLLFAISMAFTVLIRQSARRVKAPVWFPPPASGAEIPSRDGNYPSLNPSKYAHSEYEAIKPVGHKSNLNKAFDDFASLLFPGGNSKGSSSQESPSSSDSSHSNNDYDRKPIKMRKLDMQSQPVMIYSNGPESPPCYPSPPESLPGDQHHSSRDSNYSSLHSSQNPINLRGGSFCITPLMVFIMGRSKLQHAQKTQNLAHFKALNEADVIETFVNAGADLNAQNLEGETALHLAVRCGLLTICEQLIQRGAELNSFDNYGRNVLHTACGSNQLAIVKLILEHCSQQLNASSNLVLDDKYDIIDARSNDELGDTPLIIASRLNFNQVISLLIEYNVSVNATDSEGRSALHWCAKVNNVRGAYLLIQAGANVNMQDNDERTPLSAALSELNTRECAELLVKCDAFVGAEDEQRYGRMRQISAEIGASAASISDEMIAKLRQDNLNTSSFLMQKKPSVDRSLSACNRSGKRKLSDVGGEARQFKVKAEVESPALRRPSPGQGVIGSGYTPLTPSPPLSYSNFYQQQQQQSQHQHQHQMYSYPVQQGFELPYSYEMSNNFSYASADSTRSFQFQQQNNFASYHGAETYAAYF